jgi:hypothetical protein
MFSNHVTRDASAYCHGELSVDEGKKFAEHILICSKCRSEFDEIKRGIAFATQLPIVEAPDSMWSKLERQLAQVSNSSYALKTHRVFLTRTQLAVVAASLLLCSVVAIIWYRRVNINAINQPFWQVTNLDGIPTIASKGIGNTGRLSVGQWLETDNKSRAQISVGSIGHVEIDPNTRVRLLETDPTAHRLELAEGKLSARIWAPPRLFFVDTPSAIAADLGCAYTLEVGKDGSSMLRVTSGWVELQLKDRESMVPAGAACETRPGIGPGTPYFEDCSTNFRNQLVSIDFGEGRDNRSLALINIVNESRPRDTLTLWHLLSRVDGDDRVRVLEKIESFVPMPPGVTREGILRLDPEMLARWRTALEGTWQGNFTTPKNFAESYWKIKNGVTRRMSNFGSR